MVVVCFGSVLRPRAAAAHERRVERLVRSASSWCAAALYDGERMFRGRCEDVSDRCRASVVVSACRGDSLLTVGKYEPGTGWLVLLIGAAGG